MMPRTVKAVLPALLTAFLAGRAQAAFTKTWDGGGPDNLATTAANWDSDTLPGSTDDINFNGATTNKSVTWD
jgi:hypothetical protein